MAIKKNDNAYAPCRHMSDLASCMQAPSHAVPTVEFTVRNFNLPFTQDDIDWLSSAEINPFAADQRPTTGRSAISSSRNLSPSTLSFDQPFVLMGLCVYAYADPMSFTLPLNAFGPRDPMEASLVAPASPDQLFHDQVFLNTIFGNAVPANVTLATIHQAALEWGGPAWRSIWAFLHAFRLEMRAPNSNYEILMDESLADIGNCCAQTEWNGMGNSDVDPMYYVRKMNDSLAADARPIDVGVLAPFNAAVALNGGVYDLTPQRQLPIPVAYGRPMAMPTVEQWYRLPCPIPFPSVPSPKIKIVLKPGKGDEDYLDRLIEEGSIQNLAPYAGANDTHFNTLLGGGDPHGYTTSIKVPGGQLRIGIGLKGFEVRESVCERLFEVYENADNIQQAMAELGIVGAPSGIQRTELPAGPLGQE